jgi:hypothetical protein
MNGCGMMLARDTAMSRHVALLSLCCLTLGATARACPWCDTRLGTQVRDGIFNESFFVTGASLAAPFQVLALIVAVVYFWPCAHTADHERPRSDG